MKRTGRYNWVVLLSLFLLPLFSWGQTASLVATVDKNPVSVSDVFTLKITLTNGKGNIESPDLNDFRVVFGPSRSSSYRIVNGQQSSSITFSYTLKPKETGTFEIGVAKANVDGKVLTSSPIKIQVVKGASTSSSSGQNQRGSTQSTQTPSTNQNLLVKTQLSKSTVYKGEQVVISFVLLSRYNNIDLGEMDFPTLNGFWTEDFPERQTSWEPNLEIINGVQYRKAILKQQVIFPQRTGRLQIEPLTLSANVNRSFFNPGENITVRSNSPTITVKELPDGAPKSFNGAVGTFDFTATVDKSEAKANEPINLKVKVTGAGNLRLIDEPQFKFPEDFEVYDPETDDRVSVSTGGVRGSRSFQYLIIPRYPGEYSIPQLEFSFFNTNTGKFQTATAGPFDFTISDDDGNVPTAGVPRAKNIVELSGLDVRYIITDENLLSATRSQFFGTPLFWSGTAGPFALLLIFLIYRRRKEALDKDVRGRKKRGASRMAHKRLKAAEAALKSGDSPVFYQEIFKALYGYLGDKLGIPIGALSRQKILSELQRNGVKEATVNDVTYVIDTCEMARFAPVTETSDEVFYKRTAELIENLEGRLK
ncbi:BatD family protein [Cryomorphaceae bacterium 1068]|nr:BatD family protein [Cryomorphaceae bacterium 1068]